MFLKIYDAVEFYQSGCCVVSLTSNKMVRHSFKYLGLPLGQQSSAMY